jgi:hypothetical protein
MDYYSGQNQEYEFLYQGMFRYHVIIIHACRMAGTNQNLSQVEITRRLNFDN